jgi:hypothetical protein
MTFCGCTISAIWPSRASGIETMPEFGSIVQKGKFSAAMPALVSALNSVDLPTLGKADDSALYWHCVFSL